MTWKQALFLIAINAALSLLISVAVVMVAQNAQEARSAAATEAARAAAAASLLQTGGTPAPQPYLYTVRSGDSLSGIAAQFGISLAELMRMNSISDPNLLRVGEELVVPLPPGQVVTLAPPVPTATVAPLPTSVDWVPTGTATPPITRTPTPTYTPVPETPLPTTLPP
ncbi:MAG: LysM peptidoglycan-binding domain-containing protein, partial [Chloroflexi bacterium]|nr:LysM peptidoglycan-binding domain-containing protein [Chloroflexota bacterium]